MNLDPIIEAVAEALQNYEQEKQRAERAETLCQEHADRMYAEAERAERAEAEVERQKEFANNAWKQTDAYYEHLSSQIVEAEERAERAEAEVRNLNVSINELDRLLDDWKERAAQAEADWQNLADRFDNERALADRLAEALRSTTLFRWSQDGEDALDAWEEARRES